MFTPIAEGNQGPNIHMVNKLFARPRHNAAAGRAEGGVQDKLRPVTQGTTASDEVSSHILSKKHLRVAALWVSVAVNRLVSWSSG